MRKSKTHSPQITPPPPHHHTTTTPTNQRHTITQPTNEPTRSNTPTPTNEPTNERTNQPTPRNTAAALKKEHKKNRPFKAALILLICSEFTRVAVCRFYHLYIIATPYKAFL